MLKRARIANPRITAPHHTPVLHQGTPPALWNNERRHGWLTRMADQVRAMDDALSSLVATQLSARSKDAFFEAYRPLIRLLTGQVQLQKILAEERRPPTPATLHPLIQHLPEPPPHRHHHHHPPTLSHTPTPPNHHHHPPR